MTKHNERCKECKNTIRQLLESLYGNIEINYKLDLKTSLNFYEQTKFYESLQNIYHSLQNHRNYNNFVRTTYLPRVDYFVKDPGFIVEFDESQHFTECRKITLQNYPNNLNLGFRVHKWIKRCININARDNDPVFRDEQRAWYDTLRDFAPTVLNLKPTIRIYSKDFQWCNLNHNNEKSLKFFKSFLKSNYAKKK
jgi:copper chaperone CopZ